MSNLILKDVFGLLGLTLFLITIFLLFMPKQLRSINNFTGQWISVRKFLKEFEITKDMDEKILAKAKFLGVTSLFLAVLYIYWYLKY